MALSVFQVALDDHKRSSVVKKSADLQRSSVISRTSVAKASSQQGRPSTSSSCADAKSRRRPSNTDSEHSSICARSSTTLPGTEASSRRSSFSSQFGGVIIRRSQRRANMCSYRANVLASVNGKKLAEQARRAPAASSEAKAQEPTAPAEPPPAASKDSLETIVEASARSIAPPTSASTACSSEAKPVASKDDVETIVEASANIAAVASTACSSQTEPAASNKDLEAIAEASGSSISASATTACSSQAKPATSKEDLETIAEASPSSIAASASNASSSLAKPVPSKEDMETIAEASAASIASSVSTACSSRPKSERMRRGYNSMTFLKTLEKTSGSAAAARASGSGAARPCSPPLQEKPDDRFGVLMAATLGGWPSYATSEPAKAQAEAPSATVGNFGAVFGAWSSSSERPAPLGGESRTSLDGGERRAAIGSVVSATLSGWFSNPFDVTMAEGGEVSETSTSEGEVVLNMWGEEVYNIWGPDDTPTALLQRTADFSDAQRRQIMRHKRLRQRKPRKSGLPRPDPPAAGD